MFAGTLWPLDHLLILLNVMDQETHLMCLVILVLALHGGSDDSFKSLDSANVKQYALWLE